MFFQCRWQDWRLRLRADVPGGSFLSGEGDMDAGIFVMGMLIGAGLAHNFGIASSPKGVTYVGQIAVIVGLVFCLLLGFTNSRGGEKI